MLKIVFSFSFILNVFWVFVGGRDILWFVTLFGSGVVKVLWGIHAKSRVKNLSFLDVYVKKI